MVNKEALESGYGWGSKGLYPPITYTTDYRFYDIPISGYTWENILQKVKGDSLKSGSPHLASIAARAWTEATGLRIEISASYKTADFGVVEGEITPEALKTTYGTSQYLRNDLDLIQSSIMVINKDAFDKKGASLIPDEFGTTTYRITTYIHEMGHALGLQHPFKNPYHPDYNMDMTIMSYNRGVVVGNRPVVTPMALDIAALQGGIKGQASEGHTRYQPDENTDFFTGTYQARTIWDAGGNDIFNLSDAPQGVTLDLRESLDAQGTFHPERHSIIGEELVFIARGTIIERAEGSKFNDIITGGYTTDFIGGLFYTESISGGNGDDILKHADNIYGGEGNDKIYFASAAKGGAGDDEIYDSIGADGGDGNDLIYAVSAFGGAGRDTIYTSVSGDGGTGDDTVYGKYGSLKFSALHGGEGNDTLYLDIDGYKFIEKIVSRRGKKYVEHFEKLDNGTVSRFSVEDYAKRSTFESLKFAGGGNDNQDKSISGNNDNNTLTGGTGNDSLTGDSLPATRTISVTTAASFYNGSPQFRLLMNGKQVGDVRTVNAAKADGATQIDTFEVTGMQQGDRLAVEFLNDDWAGVVGGADRNLFVESISVDDVRVDLAGSRYQAHGKTFVGQQRMFGNGTLAVELRDQANLAPLFTLGDDVLEGGGGNDVLVGDLAQPPETSSVFLQMRGDAYNGLPRFRLLVDGISTGTEYEVGTDSTSFAIATPALTKNSTLAIEFLNDDWGGTPNTDRNLYVEDLRIGDVSLSIADSRYQFWGTQRAGQPKLHANGKLVFDLNVDPNWQNALTRGGDDILEGGEDTGSITLAGNLATFTAGDVLTGGNGKDTFRYALGDGADKITDFTPTVDKLDILAQRGAFTLVDVMNGAFLDFGGNKGVLVENVTASQIENDIVTVAAVAVA